jgi:hypothetical protein
MHRINLQRNKLQSIVNNILIILFTRENLERDNNAI